jgi:hypothetical protein
LCLLSGAVLVGGAVVSALRPLDGDGSFKPSAAHADVENLANGINFFAKQHGSLPTEAQGLESLTLGPSKVIDHLPQDPWGRPYVYRRLSAPPGFIVYSVGRNGVDERGAGDDIAAPNTQAH